MIKFPKLTSAFEGGSSRWNRGSIRVHIPGGKLLTPLELLITFWPHICSYCVS